jgi:hypothetical protein
MRARRAQPPFLQGESFKNLLTLSRLGENDLTKATFLKGRTLLLITLIAVLCSTSIAHVSAQEPTIRVSESPITILEEDIGKLFNVTVVIENIPQTPGTVGIEFKLRWESSVLEGVSMVLPVGHFMTPDGDDDNMMILADEANLIYPNSTLAYAHYAVFFLDLDAAIAAGYAPKSGSGTLAVITFNSTAPGETDLTFFSVKVGDQTGEPIPTPITNINGSVTVIPEFPTFIIPLLFMVATAFALILRKKELLKKQNSNLPKT